MLYLTVEYYQRLKLEETTCRGFQKVLPIVTATPLRLRLVAQPIILEILQLPINQKPIRLSVICGSSRVAHT